MDFAPLQWVASTLTIWHYLIWAVVFLLHLWRGPKNNKAMPLHLRVWGGAVCIPIVYCMGSLVLGQLFGDKFSWSELWPSGLATGAAISTFFLVAILWETRAASERKLELLSLAIVVIPFATGFFGLFLAFAWWVFPRVAGFGLFDFPKLSWGVQL